MSNIDDITGLGLTISELAVKHGLISVSDLEKAMKICADLENSHDVIPQYLIAQNLISQKNYEKLLALARAIAAREKDVKFGTIAIKKKFITQSMLQLALDEQVSLLKNQKKYTLLGDILIAAGMLTLQQREIILLEQNRYYSRDTDPSVQSQNNETDSLFSTAESNIDEEISALSSVANSYENNSLNFSENNSQGFSKKISQSSSEGTSSDTSQNTAHDSVNKYFAQSEQFPCGIRLIIKGDANAAYFLKDAEFDKNMSIGQIKELLASRNIIHGIVENNLIQKFIDSDMFLTKAFKIAEGNAPIQGKNASIQYFFTKNRLKSGTIRENGTIDFRERGNIPQVEKGTVLAIKKNAVEGQVGKNIFNDTIRVIPTRDIRLKAGKGAVLSPDKLKVIADVSGHPKLSYDGKIYVYETFVVNGNVDFKTGNIDYHGDVIVRGCIQNGFKVKANNVRAAEVDGATIIAQGNVIIEQGINESTISSVGSLSAKFIQNSNIYCVGDLTTEKEIVESNIECSGVCNIKGIVIYSKISAKMGLYAKQIGMEKSPPCTVQVGVDIFADKTLNKLNQDITDKKEMEKMFSEAIVKLQNDIQNTEAKILHLTSSKEPYEDKRMELLSAISSLESTADEKKSNQIQSELNLVIKNSKEISRKIAMCHDNIMTMRHSITDTEQHIKENLAQTETLLEEKKTLIEWVTSNQGIPMLKVTGIVVAGTYVAGRHSEET
ncbi:MAG: DUF342 domain-containing protein, partial [Desulfamplus sp.]|nr:DUF342 domain-containing protein [Desulfamplus sp.]